MSTIPGVTVCTYVQSLCCVWLACLNKIVYMPSEKSVFLDKVEHPDLFRSMLLVLCSLTQPETMVFQTLLKNG